MPPAGAGLARGLHAPASIALFRLGDQACAVAASAVVEILAAVAVTPLPRQPAYIAGVVDLRGSIVPVLDVRVRFGMPARPMELSDRLIVIRAAGRLLMLWVDDVEAFAPVDFTTWNSRGRTGGRRSGFGRCDLDRKRGHHDLRRRCVRRTMRSRRGF